MFRKQVRVIKVRTSFGLTSLLHIFYNSVGWKNSSQAEWFQNNLIIISVCCFLFESCQLTINGYWFRQFTGSTTLTCYKTSSFSSLRNNTETNHPTICCIVQLCLLGRYRMEYALLWTKTCCFPRRRYVRVNHCCKMTSMLVFWYWKLNTL